MKNISKITSLFLAALLIIGLLPGCSSRKTGSCGENAWWTLDDGVLTISGTGAVEEPIEAAKEAESVIIDEGITSVENAAFKDCGSIESIRLPESLKSLGESVFEGCTALSEITLPEGLEEIGEYAFAGCTALSELNIPGTVEEIAASAFENWESAQKIISDWYEGSADQWNTWYSLYKDYFDTFKTYLGDNELRENLESFINEWGAYMLENREKLASLGDDFKEAVENDVIYFYLLTLITEFKADFLTDLGVLIAEAEAAYQNARENIQSLPEASVEDWKTFWESVSGDVKQAIEDYYNK